MFFEQCNLRMTPYLLEFWAGKMCSLNWFVILIINYGEQEIVLSILDAVFTQNSHQPSCRAKIVKKNPEFDYTFFGFKTGIVHLYTFLCKWEKCYRETIKRKRELGVYIFIIFNDFVFLLHPHFYSNLISIARNFCSTAFWVGFTVVLIYVHSLSRSIKWTRCDCDVKVWSASQHSTLSWLINIISWE